MDGSRGILVHPDVRKKICDLLDSMGVSGYTIDVTSGSAKGENHMGIIAKLVVTGKDAGGNPIRFDWIAKSAPQEDVYRKPLKVDQVYEREVLIYRKVLPRFKRLETERGMSNFTLRTPKCVLHCLEAYRECLVMEDVTTQGYAMWNRRRPMDLGHVRMVMRAYGKLHATSYALKDQHPEEFGRMREDTEEKLFRATDRDVMTAYLDDHHEKVVACLDPVKDAKVIDVYKKYSERSVHVVLDSMLLAEEDPSAVIGHGDCWINNMLFKYDDLTHPDYPTRVCLLDWQLARYGSLAFDLSYFFYTSTDKRLRDEHYDKLIRLYYYSLCGHLVELGSDPGALVSFDVVLQQLKRYSIYGMYMATMVLRAVINDEEEDQVKTLKEDEYGVRMRGIVVDFYERGYSDFLL